MRIHSDTLTRQNFIDAAKHAGVSIAWEMFEEHGSRSRARAFTIHLAGTSRYRGGWAGNNGYNAATWDEWGIVFAHLFDVDPQAHCRAYMSAEHFHWVTGGRFRTLTPLLQHKRHKWNAAWGSVITGSYAIAECDCGAINRWMIGGHKWEEISA